MYKYNIQTCSYHSLYLYFRMYKEKKSKKLNKVCDVKRISFVSESRLSPWIKTKKANPVTVLRQLREMKENLANK